MIQSLAVNLIRPILTEGTVLFIFWVHAGVLAVHRQWLSSSMLKDECMHDAERRAGGALSGTPKGDGKSWKVKTKLCPNWTYAFCVLQTFHRLCKTSESVRPLETGADLGEEHR